MAKEPSAKQKAWPIFDRIVATEMVDGEYTSPWAGNGPNETYSPDYATLTRLLGVPLF
ncbi:hypothetical protein [Conyzicola sp.]|uniref:hypothetical protein n=1 Tax=Conyzicola sp. TaxID=1969404 RepID=UPI00398978BD